MSPRRAAAARPLHAADRCGPRLRRGEPRRLATMRRRRARPRRPRRARPTYPARRALAACKTGRDVRLLPAGLPRDRRRPGSRRRAGRPGRALQVRRLRPAHLPSARARDRPPRVRQVQERHGRRAVRARDVLVGLPPRPHGELHLAVRRQAAAHEDERHLHAGSEPPLLARLLQLLARPRPRAHDPLHAGHLPRAALLQRDHAQLGAPVVLQRRLHAEHRRQRQRHAPRRSTSSRATRSTPATRSRSRRSRPAT